MNLLPFNFFALIAAISLLIISGVPSADSAWMSRSVFGKKCKVERTTIASTEISEAPDWLFIPSPTAEFLAYSSAKDQNYLFHRPSRTRIAVPGSSDFVFSPDYSRKEKFGIVSVPHEPTDGNNPVITPEQAKKHYLAIYDPQSILDCEPQVLFRDKEMLGNYQTIGHLSTEGNTRRYRIIAAREGIKFRDYELTYLPTGIKMKPISKAKNLCPKRILRLPKISPDGKQLAAYDVEAQRTKIFRIRPDDCEDLETLPFATGKVDFSYDGKFLAYHKISPDRPILKKCPAPVKSRQLPPIHFGAEVYVWDRTKKAERKIALPECYSSIFPRFLHQGQLALQLIGDTKEMPTQYRLHSLSDD